MKNKPSMELAAMEERLEDLAAVISEDMADKLDRARRYVGEVSTELNDAGL